jgi:hypothetical protein
LEKIMATKGTIEHTHEFYETPPQVGIHLEHRAEE